jgi:two-component system OmpR family response regulator
MKTDQYWPPFRVLCVDDNPDAADSTALLLNTVGFEAKACHNGASALALNETFRPGACFIDLNMPSMPGDELAKRLRSGLGWRPLLLVAVTAMSDEQARTRIEEAGFDLHLVKPVDPEKLVQVVDNLFRAAAVSHKTGTAPGVQGTD